MRVAWICLLVVSIGILGFGLVAVLPAISGHDPLMRADGLASIGVGLFGGLIGLIPFRRRERWAWLVLWFYPVFWMVHLVGGLPPGKDHIHQVVFVGLSLTGLLLPVGDFMKPWRADGHIAPPKPSGPSRKQQ